MCKWTRPFWGTDCRRSPKSLSSARAASLYSLSIERAQKCLQGKHFVSCGHSSHSLLFGCFLGSPGGSAAVCDPNPPRPFARYGITLTRRYPKLIFRINCRRNYPEMPLPNARALTRIARNWLRELIEDYPYPGLPGINFLN